MTTAVSKVQLIERISKLNRSARAEFLAEFEEAELQQYLTNLESVWTDFQEQFYQTSEGFDSEYEFEPALMAG
jgi:methionine synthase II (cobalamin-independent)